MNRSNRHITTTKGFLNFYNSIIALLIILLSSSNSLYSQDGPVEFNHANGQVSSKGNLIDGKPEGFWQSFNEKGVLISEGNRKDYLLDSTWNFYNNKGQLMESINYLQGKKHGYSIKYDTLGIKRIKQSFNQGALQDTAEYYYANGTVSKRLFYESGKTNGKCYEYGRDSRIISILDYRYGVLIRRDEFNRKDGNGLRQGIWKTFHANGRVKGECRYVDDVKQGICKEYSREGSLVDLVKYDQGEVKTDSAETLMLEIRTKYYKSGKVAELGTYSRETGKKEGLYREYDEDGQVTSATFYKGDKLMAQGVVDQRGQRQGEWKEYYLTGEKRAEGKYKDGKKEGKWTYFFKSGKTEQKGSYKKGRSNGSWRWYYENDQLHREESYRRGKEDGESVEYDRNSNVISKGEYVDGLREGPWIYQVGDHTEEGEYIGGEKHGIWKHLYDDGTKNFVGEYENGAGKGKHRYYHPNGKLKLEGKHKAGLRSGDWFSYDETGELIMTIRYKDGNQVKLGGRDLPGPYLNDL